MQFKAFKSNKGVINRDYHINFVLRYLLSQGTSPIKPKIYDQLINGLKLAIVLQIEGRVVTKKKKTEELHSKSIKL